VRHSLDELVDEQPNLALLVCHRQRTTQVRSCVQTAQNSYRDHNEEKRERRLSSTLPPPNEVSDVSKKY
jgi:hypothetical protein